MRNCDFSCDPHLPLGTSSSLLADCFLVCDYCQRMGFSLVVPSSSHLYSACCSAILLNFLFLSFLEFIILVSCLWCTRSWVGWPHPLHQRLIPPPRDRESLPRIAVLLVASGRLNLRAATGKPFFQARASKDPCSCGLSVLCTRSIPCTLVNRDSGYFSRKHKALPATWNSLV